MKNMTTFGTSLVAASVLLGLGASATTTHAQDISASNVFTGTSVTTQGFTHLNPVDNPDLDPARSYGDVTAQYGVNTENYGFHSNVTDGTTAFSTPGGDYGQPDYTQAGYDPATPRNPFGAINITGFNSAIDSLSIYSDNGGRDSANVTIYYSSALTSSTMPDNTFQELGTFALAYADGTSRYVNTAAQSGFYYDTLSDLGIPTGTQSLLLQFDFTNTQYVPLIAEVQGFAPAPVETPEPSTWALMFLGVAGLLFVRQVRNQQLKG